MNSEETARIAEVGRRVRESVGTAVVGMDEALTIALAAIFAGGHVLFEDVPGLGKTLAARSRKPSGVSGWKLAGLRSRSVS